MPLPRLRREAARGVFAAERYNRVPASPLTPLPVLP
jgi:hypothetical protein